MGFESVPGLFICNGETVRNTRVRHPKLIKPDFRGLPIDLYRWDLKKSILSSLKPNYGLRNKEILILPFRFVNGCPFQCAFCESSGDNALEHMQPHEVVECIRQLSEEFNTPYFVFFHDTVNFSLHYMNRVCDAIIESGLEIYWADDLSAMDIDEATLRKMWRSGCRSLIFGFETGSPRMLSYIGKRLDLTKLSHALEIAHRLHIWTGLGVIPGLPTEETADTRQTIRFLKTCEKHTNHIHVTRFFLSRGSNFFREPARYSLSNVELKSIDDYVQDHRRFISYREDRGRSYDQVTDFGHRATWEVIKASPIEKVNVTAYFAEHLCYLFALYAQEFDFKTLEKVYYATVKELIDRSTPGEGSVPVDVTVPGPASVPELLPVLRAAAAEQAVSAGDRVIPSGGCSHG